MDPIFTADVRLSYEDLRAFNIYFELKKGNKFRVSILFLGGIAVMLLGAIALQFLNKFSVYYLVYAIIVLLLPLGRYAVLVSRTKSGIREYEQSGSKSRYDFTEEGVLREKTDATGTTKTEFKYDSYVRAVETTKAFYLYITENDVNIIPRGSLTKGTPQELEKFLDNKMGASFVIVENKRR